MKQILSGIENQKNIIWNDVGNLVLDECSIPSSNIIKLLRSAVIKKELTIPGWSLFMDKFWSYYDEKKTERFLVQQRFREPRRILRLKSGF